MLDKLKRQPAVLWCTTSMVMLTTKMFLHTAHVPKALHRCSPQSELFRSHHTGTGNYSDRKGLHTNLHLATSSHPVPRITYQKGSRDSAAHSSTDRRPSLTISCLPSSRAPLTAPGTRKETLAFSQLQNGGWSLAPGARKSPPPL